MLIVRVWNTHVSQTILGIAPRARATIDLDDETVRDAARRWLAARMLVVLGPEMGDAEPAAGDGTQGEDGATGPMGPAGPPGADGAAGATGATGPAGPQGPPGADGAPGIDGAPGAAGADGEQGNAGPQGLTGLQGPEGDAGPTGPKGDPGDRGADGADGTPGADGATGPEGPQGPLGNDGATGPAGADGAAGAPGIQGPPGVDGEDGAAGAKGDQGIKGNPGVQGDAGADGAPGFSGGSIAKKTGDQTFANATPADVTGLSFAVTAGRYYHFKFVLLVQSNTATVGIAATVTIPAATRFGATARTIIAVDGVGAEFAGAITASGDAVVPTAVPVINTDYVMVLEGVIVPSANGTLQLQARTETGTTNVIVRQGSCGMLWDFGV